MFDQRDPRKNDPGAEFELDADAPDADARAEGDLHPESAPATAQDAPRLAEQLAQAAAERDELRHTLVRRQADFENFRKRIERESREGGQRAVARLVEEMLPVLDAFERALAAHDDPAYADYRKGFELIYRQLWDILARQGLERVEAEGRRFDPHEHQAIERVESEDHEDGAVLQVLHPGYRIGDRLLRPAIVRVAVHPAPAKSEAQKRVN